jgi:hypothetical protein
LRRLRDLTQFDQQPVKVFDYVAAFGSRVGHPGDARAANDRRIGTHGAEALDVAAVLDTEANGDRDIRLVS